MRRVLVLNGPNLGRLGTREPEIYGATTYAQLEALCVEGGKSLGLSVEMRQSEHEGTIVEWLHEAADEESPLVLNAGALTHTSVAIGDLSADGRPDLRKACRADVRSRHLYFQVRSRALSVLAKRVLPLAGISPVAVV